MQAYLIYFPSSKYQLEIVHIQKKMIPHGFMPQMIRNQRKEKSKEVNSTKIYNHKLEIYRTAHNRAGHKHQSSYRKLLITMSAIFGETTYDEKIFIFPCKL